MGGRGEGRNGGQRVRNGGRGGRQKINEGWRIRRVRNMDRDEGRKKERRVNGIFCYL